MRVFIAIEFSDEIKNYLNEIKDIVIKESKSGSFTAKENFHLTLKFIGEVNESQLESIKGCIDKVAINQKDFEFNFSNLGEFPRGNKKIIWIGLQANEKLYNLYLKLEETLADISIKKEDIELKPHITIGRQIVLEGDFNKLKENINIDDMCTFVNKISLMQSTRVNGELKYLPIYSKLLK